MIYTIPIIRHVGSRPVLSRRIKGAKVAALLASCCIPSAASFAQTAKTQDCPPAPAYGLATNLATLKVGDYWIYEQSGTVTLPASSSTSAAPPAGAAPTGPPTGSTPSGPVPISGTFVETVETRTFQGQPTLALVVVQNLTIAGASIYGTNPAPQEIFYVQQDPTTNNVLVIGDNAGPNGTDRVAATPEEFYPGAWSTSTSYNDTLNFGANGSTGLYLNVTGTTTVNTRIGDFQAWVAPNGATTATGGVLDTGIDYWTPQLGAPVAFSTVTNLPDGSVRSLTATLIKSSRVPSLYPVLADNLSQPRGLAFDPLGNLWLTEAGVGGTGPCIPFMGTVNCFGNSGKVSVLAFGRKFTVDGQLGSLATPLVDQATGPNGITFAEGRPYVVLGDGGPQSAVSQLGTLQSQLGVLITAGFSPSGIQVQTVASLADYMYANNPNPGSKPTAESNPYGVTSIGRNVYVADGGGQTITQVTPAGAISVVAIIPNQSIDMPAFPGAPVPTAVASVPTGIMPSPDGKGLLVADYSGYPYFPGTSRIWEVPLGQAPTVFASGFTNLIGLSPAGDGGVYALEMVDKGALSGDFGGSVVYVSPSGQQTVIACNGLIQPTGIATGPDGNLYVSNYGVTQSYGQVVKIRVR